VAREVLDQIEEMAASLEEQAAEAEETGRMPDDMAKRVRASGIIRMLQPADFGGFECDPRDFFEAVMRMSAISGATGWVAGIVGVHPWELALCDRRLQEEVWGADPDTWIASPYAPDGRARPVDGGFELSGHWQFSSGTDHCDWIFLGGLVTDQEGNLAKPLDVRHFVLPRHDYQIVDDSWDVVGLRGTGSKDIIIDKAFVPLYRTIKASAVVEGTATTDAGRDGSPLYRTPWSAIFPPAITAAVIGIAEGALAAHIAYQRDRVAQGHIKMAQDPWALATIGEAASEIHSCRVQLLGNVGAMYDMAVRGEEIPLTMRAAARRDQVRASWRAVRAVDTIFDHSGGNALRMDQPLQRFWRDAHAGLHHAINVYGPIYSAYSKMEMGHDAGNVFALTI